MNISTQEKSEHTDLIAALYTAVDALNVQGVVDQVTEDVRFQLGNGDPIVGRDAVRDANAAFFGTIQAMRHTITEVWSVDNTAICNGSVHYTRKDETEHEVPFAAHLGLSKGKVSDYKVFVDISGL